MNDNIPPFLDRRVNGRCRSFWMAHDNSPGKFNPFEWAEKNYLKYIDKAIILDQKEGLLPCCRGYSKQRDELPPIRTRKGR